MAKIFNNQINYGSINTIDLSKKVPAVNKRIFDTYQEAFDYANDIYDSAIEGLILTVINDEIEKNNGAYLIKKIKKSLNDSDAVLINLSSNEGDYQIIFSETEPSEDYHDNYLWLQETDNEQIITEDIQSIDINQMYKCLVELTKIVRRHEYAFSHEMNCGTVSDNNTRSNIMSISTPEPPEGYGDTEPMLLTVLDKNKKINEIKNYFLNSNLSYGVDSNSSGWTEDIEGLDDNNKYLWNYKSIIYDNNEIEKKPPRLIAIYNELRFITGIIDYFTNNDSDEIYPELNSGKWQQEIPEFDTNNKYLWNYSNIEYLVDENEGKPDYGDEGYGGANVKHLVIKSSNTEQEIRDNLQNILDNELIWCEGNNGLYIKSKGRLIKINGTSGINPDDDNEIEEIMTGITFINDGVGAIDFISSNGNKYTMKVTDNGNMKIYHSYLDSPDPTYESKYQEGVQIDTSFVDKLYINSFYCGGDGNEINEHSIQPCSHNFVELSNLTNNDINLNGFYLQYGTIPGTWETLPLWGIIPANGTFLIRGAQCSILDSNVTVIKVSDYDMEWEVTKTINGVINKSPIKFNTEKASFFLTYGEEKDITKPWQLNSEGAANLSSGYVDLVGVINKNDTTTSPCSESSPYKYPSANLLLRKYYSMDGVKQATKDANKRNNSNDWYYVDLTRNDILPDITKYTPKPSFYKKNFFYDKTSLKELVPSIVTISFGIQATDDSDIEKYNLVIIKKDSNGNIIYPNDITEENIENVTYIPNEKIESEKKYLKFKDMYYTWGSGKGATRCFNWVSKGVYDEYIWYKKINNEDDYNNITLSNIDETWTCIESYSGKSNELLENNNGTHGYYSDKSLKYYTRIKRETSNNELCTSHKVIIRNLTKGTYVYVCGKKNKNNKPLENACTNIRKFIVRSDNDVDNGFTFVHITDQQGFNWDEYQVWKYAAKYIKEKNPLNKEIQFTINTGDATQNGNRLNEWLDYFNAREPLSDLEEMYSIGNNDLCPPIPYMQTSGNDSDKINPINVTYFYTFEINENNEPFFTVNDDKKDVQLIIPSLYSFNYGKHHFICLNSEVAPTFETLQCGLAKSGLLYPEIKKWCENDIQPYTGRTEGWNIAYCHEMPFTILTEDNLKKFFNGSNFTDTPNVVERGGSRINTNTASIKDKYWFSKFCQDNNIRLVLGGHKHTQAITWPLLEKYDYKIKEPDGYKDNMGHSMQPCIQITAADLTVFNGATDLKEVLSDAHPRLKGRLYPNTWVNEDGAIKDNYISEAYRCEFELVSKITAPVYAMSQATGYKHTSNKELPADNIPWCRKYFPNDNGKPNANQKNPFFTYINVLNNKIELNVRAIKHIMNTSGKFNINQEGELCKNNFDNIISVNGLSSTTDPTSEEIIVIE